MKRALIIVVVALMTASCNLIWRFEYTPPITFAVEVRADVQNPATLPASKPEVRPQ